LLVAASSFFEYMFVHLFSLIFSLLIKIGVVCMDEGVLKSIKQMSAPPCYYPGSISNILLDKSDIDPLKKVDA